MTQEEEREITNRYVAGLTPEQAFEFFKLNRQIAADARADYAKSSAALMLAHGDKMKEYGQNATRGLFLLNGGSIIALMTLIGSSIGKTVAGVPITPALFEPAFTRFAIGLCLCLLVSMFAYLNYSGHQQSRSDIGRLANNIINPESHWPFEISKALLFFINLTWIVAIVCAIGSLIFFGLGCLSVSSVFQQLA